MKISKLYNDPFDHIIIDDFVTEELSLLLEKEFPQYDDVMWDQRGFTYDNPLEKKKTLRDWGSFQPNMYQLFMHMCSEQLTSNLSRRFTKNNQIIPTWIVPDYGLHGAGCHIHKRGDYLNVHLDYSIHPRANLQRKLNLILYLTPNWDPAWGGGLEFWSHDPETNRPKEKIKTVENIFRRAVIFDTTQNSWHGISQSINCPEGVYRKSVAMYYLSEINLNTQQRYRALYAPRQDQENNDEVLNLIEQRVRL